MQKSCSENSFHESFSLLKPVYENKTFSD